MIGQRTIRPIERVHNSHDRALVYENDDEVLLMIDLPLPGDDFEIVIGNGSLVIQPQRDDIDIGDYQYRRAFSVPLSIDVNRVVAEYKLGVLWIHLPKSGREPMRTRVFEN